MSDDHDVTRILNALGERDQAVEQLLDMHGNAWEWCRDRYDDFSRTPVFRGGGFDNWPGFLRSVDRYSSHSPSIRTGWSGFRVVREVSGDKPHEQSKGD